MGELASSPLLPPTPPVLNRLPVLVVAVVFGCFTFLVVLVSICCLAGVIFSEFWFLFGVATSTLLLRINLLFVCCCRTKAVWREFSVS